jgi:hypothetical protein
MLGFPVVSEWSGHYLDLCKLRSARDEEVADVLRVEMLKTSQFHARLMQLLQYRLQHADKARKAAEQLLADTLRASQFGSTNQHLLRKALRHLSKRRRSSETKPGDSPEPGLRMDARLVGEFCSRQEVDVLLGRLSAMFTVVRLLQP